MNHQFNLEIPYVTIMTTRRMAKRVFMNLWQSSHEAEIPSRMTLIPNDIGKMCLTEMRAYINQTRLPEYFRN